MTATTTIPTAEPTRSPAPAEETGVTATVLLVDETGFADEARAALQSAGYDVAPAAPTSPPSSRSRGSAPTSSSPPSPGSAPHALRPAARPPRRPARPHRPRAAAHRRATRTRCSPASSSAPTTACGPRCPAPSSRPGCAPRPPARRSPPSWSAATCAPACCPRAACVDEAGRELERGRRASRNGGFGGRADPGDAAAAGAVRRRRRDPDRDPGHRAARDEPGPLERVGPGPRRPAAGAAAGDGPDDVERRLGALARRIAATRLRPRQRGHRPGHPGDRVGARSPRAGTAHELLDRAPTAVRVGRPPPRPAAGRVDPGPRGRRPRTSHRAAPAGPRSWTGCGCRPSSWPPWCWASACRSWRTSRLGSIGWDVSGVAYWVVMARPRGHRRGDLARGLLRPRPAQPPERAGCAVPVRDGASSRPTCPTRPPPSSTPSRRSSACEYPGDLQILVAYNTPDADGRSRTTLHEMARARPADRAARGRRTAPRRRRTSTPR